MTRCLREPTQTETASSTEPRLKTFFFSPGCHRWCLRIYGWCCYTERCRCNLSHNIKRYFVCFSVYASYFNCYSWSVGIYVRMYLCVILHTGIFLFNFFPSFWWCLMSLLFAVLVILLLLKKLFITFCAM